MGSPARRARSSLASCRRCDAAVVLTGWSTVSLRGSPLTTLRPSRSCIVCTGNICRSPMAEAILRHRLERSASTPRSSRPACQPTAQPATDTAVERWPIRGLDIPTTAAGCSPPSCWPRADLVVGMAREHVREAVVAASRALLPHLHPQGARARGAEVGAGPPTSRSTAGCAPAHAGPHTPMQLWARPPLDDVADPIGAGPAVYERDRRRARSSSSTSWSTYSGSRSRRPTRA